MKNQKFDFVYIGVTEFAEFLIRETDLLDRFVYDYQQYGITNLEQLKKSKFFKKKIINATERFLRGLHSYSVSGAYPVYLLYERIKKQYEKRPPVAHSLTSAVVQGIDLLYEKYRLPKSVDDLYEETDLEKHF